MRGISDVWLHFTKLLQIECIDATFWSICNLHDSSKNQAHGLSEKDFFKSNRPLSIRMVKNIERLNILELYIIAFVYVRLNIHGNANDICNSISTVVHY